MAAFVALLLLINVPAPLLGLEFDGDSPASAAPPGWLVVAAWLVLFPGMGFAHWRLATDPDPALARLSPWVVVLASVCAAYAYYTLGLARVTGWDPLWLGLIGNGVVVVLAATLGLLSAGGARAASAPLAAVAVWTAFASVSVVQELHG